MSTFPSDASLIPAPEPVAAVVIDTFGYCRWYAAAQVPISWASSVLPVSDRVCDPGAGAEGNGPPGADNADDNPGVLPELALPPPLHAVTRTSGTAVATASSFRYRSATDRCPSLSA